MNPVIIPIVLAGGSGTRLWPLSRKNYPKQFLRLNQETSLLQQTVHRLRHLPVEQALIITNEHHYFLCQEQLQETEFPLCYLLEPCPRNTAPAIAAAAHYVANTISPDAVLLILPADHWVADEQAWKQAMLLGCGHAFISRDIVTFGIQPTHAETAYGYIEAIQNGKETIHKVKNFQEKPSVETASIYVEKGNYYWNSGMFATKVCTYLNALQKHAHHIYEKSAESIETAHIAKDYLRLETESFAACESISIDYAIMEKAKNVAVIPVDMQWSDLGCWSAVAKAKEVNEDGNALIGNVLSKESKNNLVISDNTFVATLGIENQIVIATSDAVLVADKRYSQQVKDIVQSLEEPHQKLAQEHTRVPRPWGYYEILAEGPGFKVKRLMVKPGQKLSLQMHMHRSEHWVIVCGVAEIVNDAQVLQLKKNQSTYIPPQTRHRLSNPGDEPLFVIEVQNGSYLGEDDIIRFDDIYMRDLIT